MGPLASRDSSALVGTFVLVSAEVAWAQATPGPPSDAGGGSTLWAAVAIIIGLLVVIGVAVKLFDLRRRREAEAVQLQAQVSDALLREPTLAGIPLTPTAHVPFWSGTPATVAVAGQVPNPEMRELVLRIVRDEAARVRGDVRVEDHLALGPEQRVRVA
jgi:hypothetical protein